MNTLSKILGIAGVILLLFGLAMAVGMYGPNSTNPSGFVSWFFSWFYNGRQVTCNVVVNAPIIGQPLVMKSVVCTGGPSCVVNPTHSLSLFGIGDVSGSLALWQSGSVYDTVSVTQNVLGSPGAYSLSACVPKDASQVRVGVLNSNGGVINDQAVTIQ